MADQQLSDAQFIASHIGDTEQLRRRFNDPDWVLNRIVNRDRTRTQYQIDFERRNNWIPTGFVSQPSSSSSSSQPVNARGLYRTSGYARDFDGDRFYGPRVPVQLPGVQVGHFYLNPNENRALRDFRSRTNSAARNYPSPVTHPISKSKKSPFYSRNKTSKKQFVKRKILKVQNKIKNRERKNKARVIHKNIKKIIVTRKKQ